MDTQSIKLFIAIAEEGSFTGAAEKTHLTQPAVSKRIALLESQLNCRLFDRIGRHVQLTEAGLLLLPKARHWLSDMDDIKRSISNLTDDVSGVLRIGISHHIGLHRLPPLLRHFTHAYPDVRLDIRFIDSEEAWEAVWHGELELGVVTLPPKPDMRIQHTPIWNDPLIFMAANDHPLAGMTRIPLATLTRYEALLPSTATFTRQLVTQLFEKYQLKAQVAMSTNYLETLYMMVSIGLGWSLLPATLLDSRARQLDVIADLPTRHLGYIIHPQRSLSNAARCFVELLEQAGSQATGSP